MPLRLLQNLGTLRSIQHPGVEASPVVDLEARRFAVTPAQVSAADDLDRPNQHASGQSIDVDAELGGDPRLFFRIDPTLPGVDVDPLPEST